MYPYYARTLETLYTCMCGFMHAHTFVAQYNYYSYSKYISGTFISHLCFQIHHPHCCVVLPKLNLSSFIMIVASFCLIILWLALSMITKPNTTNYTYRSAVYNYYSYKQTGNNFVDKSCNLCSYKHYIF